MKFTHALIPAPGHYSSGRVGIVSRHKSSANAKRRSKTFNNPNGLRVVITDDVLTLERGWFWADMPPTWHWPQED